jgi:hypothetical protein
MKTSLLLAATLGTALSLGAQTADRDQARTQARSQDRLQTKDQTQTQDRVQAKDQTQTQTQSRLRKRDGSCGQTPGTGTGQRLGQSSGNRGGRGR